jgi:threonine dehydrogenase-like Zn-dependent dehydrogenase
MTPAVESPLQAGLTTVPLTATSPPRYPDTARVAVLDAPRKFGFREQPIMAPAAAEVLVRVEGCGVCASSLPVWEGRPWFTYPLAAGMPGHEGWGRVAAVGEKVTGVAVGDRVAMLTGTAFAAFTTAREEEVVVLPEALDGEPFPGEPLGCVMNILERADIRAGQTVAVVGVGFVGAALVSLAVQRGARVIALSRRPYARELALARGAHAVFTLDGEGVQQALREIRSAGAERVVEAVGTQQALDAASTLCGTRSRLVIAGYHQDGARMVDMQSWNWRGIDVINAHERDPQRYRAGIEAAVAAVLSGQLDARGLFTHTMPLSDLPSAFALLEHRPAGFLKAMVTLP